MLSSGADDHPSAPGLPAENVNGHLKKLLLLRRAIDEARRRMSLDRLRILDVGCGSGVAVTQHLGNGKDDVLGIDTYEPNIQYASAMLHQAGLRFELRSAESLAESQAQFDVIVLADILEHLTNPEIVLTECRRLAAPGGLLLVTVPNGVGPFELESALSRLPVVGPCLLKLTDYFVATLNRWGPFKGAWTAAAAATPANIPYNAESGHIQFFRFRQMRSLLEKTGFEVYGSANLSVFSGPFTNYYLGAWPGFCRWNARIADRVPKVLASAWLFESIAG